MDNSYFGHYGPHNSQGHRIDGTNCNDMSMFGQQWRHQRNGSEQLQIQHQLQLQPPPTGQPRSRGSSFAGSPTSPASAHRPAVSQPSATQLQPDYFAIGATGALQPQPSPVSSRYDLSPSQSITSMLDYRYEADYSDMSMHEMEDNGTMVLRNQQDYSKETEPSQSSPPDIWKSTGGILPSYVLDGRRRRGTQPTDEDRLQFNLKTLHDLAIKLGLRRQIP